MSKKEFDEVILEQAYTNILTNYYNLLPDGRISKALTTRTSLLPTKMVDMSWRIKRFLDKHGTFSPLAIGLMSCIIDMDRMGLSDCRKYFTLIDYLDVNRPANFNEYVKTIVAFEKEWD